MDHDEIRMRLWSVISKLHGMAALIKNWNCEPLASNDDTHDAIHGLGMIIADLADDVKEIWKEFNEDRNGQNDTT